MKNIKRQKIVERENFTYEEKMEFARKSNERCCHCGKKVYPGYGATVEHFIPLSQGGTNRDINMVMLCDNCNQEKNNFIYRPEDYLEYLEKEHLDKLQGYFDSYIQSFDFINRDNLLACDRYKVYMSVVSDNLFFKAKKNKKTKHTLGTIPLWIKRATFEDVDKLTEYFIKYLKKYNSLDSEKAARINIEFWITFGCIYYIEKDNEIKTFVTVTVTKSNEKVTIDDKVVDHILTINIFTYYSSDYAFSMGWHLSRQIPRYIAKEQNIKCMPVRYSVLQMDELSESLCMGGKCYNDGKFLSSFIILKEKEEDEVDIHRDEQLSKFFNRFKEVQQGKFEKWFKDHGEDTYEWLIEELAISENNKEIINDRSKEKQSNSET